jgi:hypothetical protein
VTATPRGCASCSWNAGRAAGYRRVTLSTYDVLGSARRIYQGAGFIGIHDEKERSFGKDLVAQEWERTL